jgi:hypothetical protein
VSEVRLHITVEYWYDTDTDNYPPAIRESPRKMAEYDAEVDSSIMLENATIQAAMFGKVDPK